MTSKREQALAGLFLCLQNGDLGDAELQRNEPLPIKIPASGLLILRDGYRDIKELCELGLICKIGNDRNEYYATIT